MTGRRRFAWLSAGFLLLAVPSLALANWTATGRFVYADRVQDLNGFTGVEPQKPIRLADVQVIDNAGTKLLASGATDINGNFSIPVVDNKTRTVYVRVLSQSLKTPGLWIDVQNGSNQWYALAGANVSGHNPNTNTNFGTIVAVKGVGGEVFNIYDNLLYGADYIAFIRGSRPPQADDLTALWKSNRGVMDSTYQSALRNISLRDTGAWDDTVILHEMGHYMQYEYSRSDSPGGSHTFTDCDKDLRLVWDEGWGTYWGNSVLKYSGLPNPSWYIRTNGTTGTGGVVRTLSLESDSQYMCTGPGSEVNVAQFLWDVNDNDTTPDGVAGDDDTLAEPDIQVWEVLRDYFPGAGVTNRSLEDFWDGWFLAPISNGHLTEMRSAANTLGIQYSEDTFEVNNTVATAAPAVVGGSIPVTFFYDQDGDGAGQADTDVFWFASSTGTSYTIQTNTLLGDANTFLELLDTNGTTVLASNDDRVSGDQSSLIQSWVAPRDDTFYIRITHTPDTGIYGSYNLAVTVP